MIPPLAAIWCVDVLPTHDGPKNLYAAHVRFHLENPSYAAQFKGRYPVTAFGFGLVYGAAQTLLPWKIAYKVSWTVLLVGGAAAYYALVRSLDPRRWPLGILGFAAAMHWAVYMGFVNYLGSLALGLATLAYGLSSREWSGKKEWALAGLMLLTCAFHPVGAQLAGVGLLVYRTLTSQRGKRIRQLGALFLVGAPAAAVTIVSADILNDLHDKGLVMIAREWLPFREAATSFARCYLSGPAWRSLPLVVAAFVGCAYALVDLVRRRLDAKQIALLLVSMGAAAAALEAPLHGATWEYFSPRFIPIAVLLGVALLPLERLPKQGYRMSIVVVFAFDIASNA